MSKMTDDTRIRIGVPEQISWLLSHGEYLIIVDATSSSTYLELKEWLSSNVSEWSISHNILHIPKDEIKRTFLELIFV